MLKADPNEQIYLRSIAFICGQFFPTQPEPRRARQEAVKR
jgi:hypothetical protein